MLLDKPAGLGVQDGRAGEVGISGRLGLLLCHRLDVVTSGVLVLAKTAGAQREVSAAFSEGRVFKSYLAVCWVRRPLGDVTEITVPLGDWKRGRVAIGKGRDARTRVRVASLLGDRARVIAEPLTGRTHQVRAHLSYVQHPIIGDDAYGGPVGPRVLLHAAEVRLTVAGRDILVKSPEPEGFSL